MEEGAGRKVGSCLFTRRPMHAAQTENACGYSASEAGNQVQRWQGENAGNRRRSRLKRYADKLATELLDGASTAGSVSRFFAMRSLRCALRQAADSHAPFTPLGMTVFISSSSRRSAPFSVSVLCVSLLHCEKSGRSGGDSASARSGCAQTAQILRARSASAGGDTRGFSPCLIFCCFWIKPKAEKKKLLIPTLHRVSLGMTLH